MLRALIYGLTILHLGPGFAFAVLAFGCDSFNPALGDFCTGNQLKTFAWLTLGAWVILIAGYIVWQALARKQQSKS